MTATQLERLLELAAAGQLVVAAVNLGLVRLLRWRAELERLPLLMRQVFQVHVWFISLTLIIFALLTWRFAAQMAAGTNAVCTWLAAAVGMFWGVRTLIQVAYYSPSHWRGKLDRTMIHVLLFVLYGGIATVYLTAAFR